jgi:hypothetical protein
VEVAFEKLEQAGLDVTQYADKPEARNLTSKCNEGSRSDDPGHMRVRRGAQDDGPAPDAGQPHRATRATGRVRPSLRVPIATEKTLIDDDQLAAMLTCSA